MSPVDKEPAPGLPTPGRPAPSPTPAPQRTIQAYLRPELPPQAQPGGVAAAAATALRSRGCDSLSPRPAPGGRQHGGGARAAPGNRPSAGGGPRGRLRSGTRRPLRQYQARLGRREKNTKDTLESKKSQRKHFQGTRRIASKRRRKSRVALFLCGSGQLPAAKLDVSMQAPPLRGHASTIREARWELAGLCGRSLERVFFPK